jgi:hypothetical protein
VRTSTAQKRIIKIRDAVNKESGGYDHHKKTEKEVKDGTQVAKTKVPHEPFKKNNEYNIEQEERPWKERQEYQKSARAKVEERIMSVDTYAKNYEVAYEHGDREHAKRHSNKDADF